MFVWLYQSATILIIRMVQRLWIENQLADRHLVDTHEKFVEQMGGGGGSVPIKYWLNLGPKWGPPNMSAGLLILYRANVFRPNGF